MTKSTTLPPDITVTRADVLALPSAAGSGIICLDEGRVWKLWRMGTGRVVWMEVPEGTAGADVYACGVYLSQEGAAVAERAFLWQTALASDAALADIGNDPAPTAPPIVDIEISHLTLAQREEVAALMTKAVQTRDRLATLAMANAIRSVTAGLKV